MESRTCCNSTYRLRYWNEVNKGEGDFPRNVLQQYLPFTVLKHFLIQAQALPTAEVATVPTIYGIETTQRSDARYSKSTMLQQYLPFTVLKPEDIFTASHD